ncbi:MAG: SGNH/GDSL hydrolase family protein [Kiritimatiellae bacterium]|nr:SGNH/GDSL hydrolase family protein [Kiritimatiellia bacterium]
MKTALAAVVAALAASVFADDISKTCPVSDRLRGHEQTEWSMYNAGGMIHTNMPRVLLVGDSITAQYQGGVAKLLKGKMYMSYWASSYCVTSPVYMKLLEAFLDDPTLPYDVVHFNNGLHSLATPVEAYAKRYREAVALIRRKAPKAKIIIATSTPLKDAKLTVRVRALNEVALAVAKENGLEVNDLFARLDPMDREANWSDTYHHRQPLKEIETKQVADAVLKAAGR